MKLPSIPTDIKAKSDVFSEVQEQNTLILCVHAVVHSALTGVQRQERRFFLEAVCYLSLSLIGLTVLVGPGSIPIQR